MYTSQTVKFLKEFLTKVKVLQSNALIKGLDPKHLELLE